MSLIEFLLHGLSSLAPALLQASAAAGGFAVLVMVARWLGRGSLPVRWLYWLGLLAMARLALPIVPESSLGLPWPSAGPSMAGAAADSVPEVRRNMSMEYDNRSIPNPSDFFVDEPSRPKAHSLEEPVNATNLLPVATVGDEAEAPFVALAEATPSWTPSKTPTVQPLSAPTSPDLPTVSSAATLPAASAILLEETPALGSWLVASAGCLWILGTSLVVLKAWGQNLRFQRRLRKKARPAEARIQALAGEVSALSPLPRPVTVLEVPQLPGPVSCGCFRPLILLPADMATMLGDSELRHILAHEVAHLRHRDSLLNWALLALCALHWFNPLAWLCRRAILTDRELIRDEEACQTLRGITGRADYGHTLVKISLFQQDSAPSPGLSAFFTTEKEIHRRIIMITHPIATPHVLKRYAAGLTTALAVLCTYTLAPAQKPDRNASIPSADQAPRARVVEDNAKPNPPTPSGDGSADATGEPPNHDNGAGDSSSPVRPGGTSVEPLPLPNRRIFGRDVRLIAESPMRAAPEDDLGKLREEVVALRAEMSAIREFLERQKKEGELEEPLIRGQRFLEIELLKAQLMKRQAEASGLGAKHPKLVGQVQAIEELNKRLAATQATQSAKSAPREDLIRKLIALKGAGAKLTGEIDSLTNKDKGQFATKDDLMEAEKLHNFRTEKQQILGALRAEIVEIETRLEYNVLD